MAKKNKNAKTASKLVGKLGDGKARSANLAKFVLPARGKTVPLPPGFREIEVIVPDVDLEEPSLDQQIREECEFKVRAGYLGDEGLVEWVLECFKGQIPKRKLLAKATSCVAEFRVAVENESKRWRKVTDCVRLDRAFDDLEMLGILARQNYWCCATCGCAAIDDEMKQRARSKRPADGYTFFDEQDTAAAVLGDGLFLNYGAAKDDVASQIAVGVMVANALKKAGLKPRWSGSLDERIFIAMKWQRKPASRG